MASAPKRRDSWELFPEHFSARTRSNAQDFLRNRARPMPRRIPARHRTEVVGLTALAVAAVLIFLLWPRPEPGLPAQHLGGGKWIQIRHVTLPTNGEHSIARTPGWKGHIAELPLPTPLRNAFGLHPGSVAFAKFTNSIGLWWSSGIDGVPPRAANAIPFSRSTVLWRIVSSNGWAFPGETLSSLADPEGRPIETTFFECYPRRQTHFQVEVFDRNSKGLLARWSVPNPAPVSPASWTPEPLPAARTNGPLAVRLEGVDWVNAVADDLAPGLTLRFKPRFKLLPLHPSSPGWESTSVSLHDPTGNRGDRLDPFEPAWQVRITAFPKPDTAVATDKVAKGPATGLRVPTGTAWASLDSVLTLDGRSHAVLGIAAPGTHTFSNAVHVASAAPPTSGQRRSVTSNGRHTTTQLGQNHPILVGYRWPDPPEGTRLVVRIRDASGIQTGLLPSSVGGNLTCFDLPADLAAPFAVELVLQKSETFEFMVHPPSVPKR